MDLLGSLEDEQNVDMWTRLTEEDDKAIRKHMYNVMYKYRALCLSEGKLTGNKSVDEFLNGIIAKTNKPRHFFWVTINPNEKNQDLISFKQKVEKALTKNWISLAHYVFEVRQQVDENNFKGLHCHLLIESKQTKRLSHCQREMYNSFKHIVGSNKAVDVKEYPYAYYQDKIRYLEGDKEDESKKSAIEATKEFRKQNKLLEIYKYSI